MKLIFNGIIEKSSGGCVPCGGKRASSKSMVTSKMYVLPSGRQVTFIVGKPEEVSASDGAFLLQYLYTDKDGNKHNVFTKED